MHDANMEFSWFLDHDSVPGNKWADAKAKAAVIRLLYSRVLLYSDFMDHIHIYPSEVADSVGPKQKKKRYTGFKRATVFVPPRLTRIVTLRQISVA